MRILLVNDDGFNSIGITTLEKALKKYGDVYVVAPDRPRSAMGHAIFIHDALSFDMIDEYHYTTNGTPADCVRLGVNLIKNIDFVFSGINDGLNLGTDVIYSGTVAAALEGTILGIKSIAISTDRNAFDIVNKELDDVLKYIFEKEIYSNDAVININFPIKEYFVSKGMKFCFQGIKNFETHFKYNGEGYKAVDEKITYDKRAESDVYLASLGYITLTPIGVDQTDYKLLKQLFNK